ncbi:hypothetical protein BZL39_B09945 [Zygosaccharomyces parabailii]|nr:hypothetical protein BZL39_B09945 [Zygosaccharomyces parabailii]
MLSEIINHSSESSRTCHCPDKCCSKNEDDVNCMCGNGSCNACQDKCCCSSQEKCAC